MVVPETAKTIYFLYKPLFLVNCLSRLRLLNRRSEGISISVPVVYSTGKRDVRGKTIYRSDENFEYAVPWVMIMKICDLVLLLHISDAKYVFFQGFEICPSI